MPGEGGFAEFTVPAPGQYEMLGHDLTSLTTCLMGAIVGLYSFRLAQPLRALSQAAARYKVGQRPELPVTGPDEDHDAPAPQAFT